MKLNVRNPLSSKFAFIKKKFGFPLLSKYLNIFFDLGVENKFQVFIIFII